jgi:hypothetical protein
VNIVATTASEDRVVSVGLGDHVAFAGTLDGGRISHNGESDTISAIAASSISVTVRICCSPLPFLRNELVVYPRLLANNASAQ